MRRSTFLAATGAASLAAMPALARATGGLESDVESPARQIRVLVASGDIGPPPRPIGDSLVSWNGRTYRGAMSTVSLPGGRVGLVDTLPLEAYLYGVLNKEISSSWPAAMQSAQAIVARTYVMMKLRSDLPYDVIASEGDQAYGGVDAESGPGRDAIDACAGSVLRYDGTMAHVAYGSCCGGHTADAGDTWGTAFPYLRDIVDVNCVGTPEYDWRVDVPYARVTAAFTSEAGPIGELRRIDVRARDRSGRAREVALIGDRGEQSIDARDFRMRLGATVVRSTLIRSVDVSGANVVTIAGNGRGHGVGMCQWGARRLADRGASAADIIAFYFPGTTIARA